MTIKNDRYLRITDILSPFSGLQDIKPFILSQAADRGTRVHQMIEDYLSGIGIWEEDSSLMGYLDSMKKFWKDGYPIHYQEQRFFNDEFMITGACDLIIEFQGCLTLVDWKTSHAPNRTWPMQGSAYSWLAKKHGIPIENILFIKLDKKGSKPQVFQYEENFSLFLKCYEIYNYFFKEDHIF